MRTSLRFLVVCILSLTGGALAQHSVFDLTPAKDWKDTINSAPKEGKNTYSHEPTSGNGSVPEFRGARDRDSKEIGEFRPSPALENARIDNVKSVVVNSPQFRTGNLEWDRRANAVIGGRAYSVRQRYGNYDVFGFFAAMAPHGHRYDLYESLGFRSMTPEQIAAVLKSDLNIAFPIRATGSNGQAVKVGNKFTLTVRGYLPNVVEVVAETPTSWTLGALPGHTLKGQVTHEVIKDSSGELWLRHSGSGDSTEGWWDYQKAYEGADYLWNMYGRNTNILLNSNRR